MPFHKACEIAAAFCGVSLACAIVHSAFAADASISTAFTRNCSPVRVSQGCGTYTWPDGSKYVGEFRAGTFEGHGVVSYADGSRLDADFTNGTAHGDAAFTARDGTKTSGALRNVGNDKSHPRAAAEYPFWRELFGGEGNVVLTVIVAEDGSVTNIQVDTPSAYPTYDEAGIAAVRQWKYLPATVAGNPVKIPHRIEIKFPDPHEPR